MNSILLNVLFVLTLLGLIQGCTSASHEKGNSSSILPQSGYISSQGVNLFYQQMGTGIPVLVLHGGPGMDHSYFLPHLAKLGDSFQFIFFDQRICGKSSWQIDSTEINMRAFVEDIEAVRKHFKIDKVNLLGHSWGGLLAMWYATEHPEKLDHLVLVNTIPANKAYEAESAQLNQSRITKEDQATMKDIMASEAFIKREKSALLKVYKLNFAASFYQRNYLDSLKIELAEDFMERQRKLSYLFGDLRSYDLYDSLSRIKAPSLIIHSDYDATPREAIEKIAKNIPASKLVMLKNTGHFPFIESKQAFQESLIQFFKP